MDKSPRERRLARRRREQIFYIVILVFAVIGFITVMVFAWKGVAGLFSAKSEAVEEAAEVVVDTSLLEIDMPELDVELLTVNEYSRPGIALEEVKGIVIHYTANPGTTALQNRDYFEGLKDGSGTHASSHFIVGLAGEIVQCIPTAEISYASNDRNYDTISIECCHMDESGKFNDETYDSLVELTAYLVCRFNLTTDDVLRHYDVSGKSCPKYFVDYSSAWKTFLDDVNAYILEYGHVAEDEEE